MNLADHKSPDHRLDRRNDLLSLLLAARQVLARLVEHAEVTGDGDVLEPCLNWIDRSIGREVAWDICGHDRWVQDVGRQRRKGFGPDGCELSESENDDA
jgi:hypothetical protein